uniref:FCD domain-containing protein n=1 Tax=Streptomyces sp. NBC_00093 TaxID=2975649 RepID=A0AAU1ZTS4_9ACTN
MFHTTLFSKVGERMRCQLEELWDHAERYRRYRVSTVDVAEVTRIAHDERAAILDAAQKREATRCGQLIAQHLARTALTSIAGLDATHDPWNVREAARFASAGS